MNLIIISLFILFHAECVNVGSLDNEGRDQSQHGEAFEYVRSPIRQQNYRLSELWQPWNYNWVSLFPAFAPTSSCLPCSPFLSGALFLILSLSDGSITGAMLRELLQPSLSGCVSSNVGVELSNLLTMQEKRKREGGGKKSLWSPNDARWEPSCAKCRRVVLPCFLSCGPRTPIYRQSHIGPFCMVGPKQLCSAEKKWQQQNKEINKHINKHIRKAYFCANARIRTFCVPSAENEPYSRTLIAVWPDCSKKPQLLWKIHQSVGNLSIRIKTNS